MTSSPQPSVSAANEDLAMVRQLAEEGRMQPLQGGKYLVMWGSLSSIGLLFTWAMASDAFAVSPQMFMLVWFALMFFGVFMSIRWGRQEEGTTVSEAIGNKVERTVWCVGGGVLGLVSIMLFAMPYFVGDRFEAAGIRADVLFGMMAPLAFGIYAIALAATSVAGRASWLRPYVILAFVFAAITLGLVWDLKQFPAAIIGIWVVIVWPGILMLRKNKN